MMFLVSFITISSMSVMVQSWSISSSGSSFSGRSVATKAFSLSSQSSLVMYDDRKDPPNDKPGRKDPWTVLATTEKWISTTLSNAQGSAAKNPYSRKEVSYVCESADDSAMIVANLFRRVKEKRELGENHGQSEVDRAEKDGASYKPSTLRQTQVMVIPSNSIWNEDFNVFNNVIEAVNQARRHARDYVTEAHWDRMDSHEAEEPETEWSVAVNVAHLHPDFGKKTPEQELEELKQQEAEGEIDVNYLEYQERRMLARRSPYPTVVIEVRATPPPDFGASKATLLESSEDSPRAQNGKGAVSAEDIMKLEQLFGQSAHMNHPTSDKSDKQAEEEFFSKIGGTIEEISAVKPLQLAQQFIGTNDPSAPRTSAFTETDTAEVDGAYEFVFTNIAMLTETVRQSSDKNQDFRYYVVLPRFVTSAATSLEKFANQLLRIVNTLPELVGHISVQTYHPEHVDKTRRSPMPILMLQWKQETNDDDTQN